jgi:hypothetical protein
MILANFHEFNLVFIKSNLKKQKARLLDNPSIMKIQKKLE